MCLPGRDPRDPRQKPENAYPSAWGLEGWFAMLCWSQKIITLVAPGPSSRCCLQWSQLWDWQLQGLLPACAPQSWSAAGCSGGAQPFPQMPHAWTDVVNGKWMHWEQEKLSDRSSPNHVSVPLLSTFHQDAAAAGFPYPECLQPGGRKTLPMATLSLRPPPGLPLSWLPFCDCCELFVVAQ